MHGGMIYFVTPAQPETEDHVPTRPYARICRAAIVITFLFTVGDTVSSLFALNGRGIVTFLISG